MATAPPRYLVAYLEARKRVREALLRFPPGVTLEDAGYDWRSLFEDFSDPDPILSADTLGHLSRLGVEVVATGSKAVSKALQLANIEGVPASPEDFADDYLGVNDRLGGERCVTVREYAMHTTVRPDTFMNERDLHHMLMDCLLKRGGVRVYGGAAFREGSLPDLLHLRLNAIVRQELFRKRLAVMPCRLHGDACTRPTHSDVYYGAGILLQSGARVAVPRQLLDDMRGGDSRRSARAALAVVRRVIDALPKDAWSWNVFVSRCLASLVALTVAETCEEHAMLVETLRRCRSLREMERCSRDPSWAVSRTLEGLRDG